MTAKSEVVGNTDSKTRRREGDNRKAVFTVELPGKQPNDVCEVHIRTEGAAMRDLVMMGAALCGVQAATEAARGEKKAAKIKLERIGELVKEMEDREENNFPTVYLPGGVTLRHALGCVAIVQRLREENEPN